MPNPPHPGDAPQPSPRSRPRTPIVTCEHGDREVPEAYAERAAEHREAFAGHRAWDPGARELANALARRLRAPVFVATVSRLLVDLNRSPDNPERFSEVTSGLAQDERDALMEDHYYPYRHGVETAVSSALAAGTTAIHLSVHTFTPTWEGEERDVDVGLLFDPDRPLETELCLRWQEELMERAPELRVRFNEPYSGVADGFTSHLRKRHPPDHYLGVELEVSQRFPDGDAERWQELQTLLCDTAQAALAEDGR